VKANVPSEHRHDPDEHTSHPAPTSHVRPQVFEFSEKQDPREPAHVKGQDIALPFHFSGVHRDGHGLVGHDYPP
jgi:hypothetical protein